MARRLGTTAVADELLRAVLDLDAAVDAAAAVALPVDGAFAVAVVRVDVVVAALAAIVAVNTAMPTTPAVPAIRRAARAGCRGRLPPLGAGGVRAAWRACCARSRSASWGSMAVIVSDPLQRALSGAWVGAEVADCASACAARTAASPATVAAAASTVARSQVVPPSVPAVTAWTLATTNKGKLR